MGKKEGQKDSINAVLAKGKAMHKAFKGIPSTGSDVPEDLRVPLSAKLPAIMTLSVMMKKNGLSYPEAVKIYHAYQSHAEEELGKVEEKKKKTRPVATPARAAPADEEEEQEEEDEPEEKPKKGKKKSEASSSSKGGKSKPASKRESKREAEAKPSKATAKKSKKDKGKEAEQEAVENEEPEAAESAHRPKAKPKALEDSNCGVKRKLTFANVFSSDEEAPKAEDEASPAKRPRRVLAKRALTNAEEKSFRKQSEGEPKCGKDKMEDEQPQPRDAPKKVTWREPVEASVSLHRQNASEEISTPTSSTGPKLNRGWLLD